MGTEKVFHTQVYEKSTDAIILEIRSHKDNAIILCNRTVFFPEGGGQPCDLGTVSHTLSNGEKEVFHIINTQEEGENVLHYTDAPADTFFVGEKIILTIDWNRRFLNMQRHAGEHILSGAIYQLTHGANKGFHMGDQYMTIDIDLGGEILDHDTVKNAEDLANTAIYKDLPIRVDRFSNAAEASTLPVRKPIHIEGEVSVVTVGDRKSPFDCVACCGTHPSTAGQIGLIRIYKTEANKGMTRIYFDCGRKAFLRCRRDMEILNEISDFYSCGTEEVFHSIEKKEKTESSLRGTLSRMNTALQSYEAPRLEALLNNSKEAVVFDSNDVFEVNELLKLGFSVIRKCSRDKILLLLEHLPTHTLLLLSKGPISCGDLVKKYAPQFGGKGGGRPDNARAVFQDRSALLSFVKIINSEI